MKEKEYKIIVKLRTEVINLTASNKEEALSMAKNAIAEDYSEDCAEDCDYEVQLVK